LPRRSGRRRGERGVPAAYPGRVPPAKIVLYIPALWHFWGGIDGPDMSCSVAPSIMGSAMMRRPGRANAGAAMAAKRITTAPSAFVFVIGLLRMIARRPFQRREEKSWLADGCGAPFQRCFALSEPACSDRLAVSPAASSMISAVISSCRTILWVACKAES